MRSTCTLILRIVVLLSALSLVACASTSTTGQTSGAAPTATATAQPTAKPGPTAPPQVTQAFCLSIMTVADANQIMNPATPATTLNVQSDPELSVCSWLSPQSPFAVVKVLIDGKPYTGPNPVPQDTIVQLATQLASEPGVTVTTTAPVTGVGDQAEFLAASASDSGMTVYADALYIIYGNVASECVDFNLNTKPDDATQQAALQQCGQRVVAQL
jgi:hypothetical protein